MERLELIPRASCPAHFLNASSKGSAAVSNEASEAAGPSVAPVSEAPAAPAAPQEPAKARGLSTASRREQWMLDDNAEGNMSSNICQTYLLAAC